MQTLNHNETYEGRDGDNKERKEKEKKGRVGGWLGDVWKESCKKSNNGGRKRR